MSKIRVKRNNGLNKPRYPKYAMYKLKKKEVLKKGFNHAPEQVKKAKTNFGSNSLKLELWIEELEKYKRAIRKNIERIKLQ